MQSLYTYFCPNHYSFFCLLHIFNTHPRTQCGCRLATVAAGSSTEANQGRVPAKPGFTSAEPRRWTHPQWDNTHAHTRTHAHTKLHAHTRHLLSACFGRSNLDDRQVVLSASSDTRQKQRETLKTKYNKQSGSTITQEAVCAQVLHTCVCQPNRLNCRFTTRRIQGSFPTEGS